MGRPTRPPHNVSRPLSEIPAAEIPHSSCARPHSVKTTDNGGHLAPILVNEQSGVMNVHNPESKARLFEAVRTHYEKRFAVRYWLPPTKRFSRYADKCSVPPKRTKQTGGRSPNMFSIERLRRSGCRHANRLRENDGLRRAGPRTTSLALTRGWTKVEPARLAQRQRRLGLT
jgi:hypothetical protein